MSAQVTELCYEGPDVGTDNAKITLICDAEAGDLECLVTASVQVSTVEPEVLRVRNVRIDLQCGQSTLGR